MRGTRRSCCGPPTCAKMNLNLARPESLLDQIEAATAKSNVTVSRHHQSVSSTLTKLEIDHKTEVSPFESSNTMHNVDIVIISKNENKKVAIGFNKPSNYVQCNGRDTGTTGERREKPKQHTQRTSLLKWNHYLLTSLSYYTLFFRKSTTAGWSIPRRRHNN